MKTTLISVAELAALPPSEVLIVDCRHDLSDAGKGERDYQAEHLPGAVFASLDHDLSDLTRIPLGLGRHPLPSEERFSVSLGRWGWRPGLQVVCYDAGNGALAAARLWWLLRLCGVKDVAVLDGGYAAWKAAGQPVSPDIPQREPTSVSLHYEAGQMLIDHAAVAHLQHDISVKSNRWTAPPVTCRVRRIARFQRICKRMVASNRRRNCARRFLQ
jgi:thiosulfate/3-mercaptopyruvate sulfurtransferase